MSLNLRDELLQNTAAQLIASAGLPADALLRLRVVGGSMRPALLPEDCLTVALVEKDQLHRGDIVVVKRPDGFVTHRLIISGQGRYLLKGDGNRFLDQPVAREDIVGIVKRVERDGAIYDFCATPLIRLNRFMGWLGLIEVRLRIGRLIRPMWFLIQRVAVSLVPCEDSKSIT